MILPIILSILATLVILGIIYFLLKKPIGDYFSNLSKNLIEESLKVTEQKSKELFKEERDRLMEQYKAEKEILDGKMKQGAQDLESKRDAIKELVERISRDLDENKKKIEKTEQERISEFSTLKGVLDEYKVITSGLKSSTDDLKNILSNNQLRGKYGEEVAENLLQSVGFVKGQNYLVNTAQDTVDTRPDFTILLPDQTKVNIDAKFPFQSLVKYQEAESKNDKDRYIKEFTTDIKEKIKQVTTRDYINPQEKTVDFVIMFVPNEMIFSFIYEQLNDVWNEALKKKVIMAGPFSFTAMLRMIYQAYKNFRYQENLHEIIKLVKTFEIEYGKFSTAFDTLGKRLKSASDQYESVSTTRSRKLTGVIDKITSEKLLSEPETPRPEQLLGSEEK